MRIVSLLPATTEILFAIGAGEEVVGVTFECDTPVQARDRRVVSTSTMPAGLSVGEIDAYVAKALAAGEDLYRLDAGALRGLEADLVVTQDLCAVCAIDVAVVDEALDYLGCTARVRTLDPHRIDEVLDTVLVLGEDTGRRRAAGDLVASLRARLHAVQRAVAGRARPRVLVLEWTDPPYAPGHWIPEMVTFAGGVPVVGMAGEKSRRLTWEQVRQSAPDVIVCAPCGYGLEESAQLARSILDRLPPAPVWAVDANGSFARPGPRIVDGVEALAALLHPALAMPSGGAIRVR